MYFETPSILQVCWSSEMLVAKKPQWFRILLLDMVIQLLIRGFRQSV